MGTSDAEVMLLGAEKPKKRNLDLINNFSHDPLPSSCNWLKSYWLSRQFGVYYV